MQLKIKLYMEIYIFLWKTNGGGRIGRSSDDGVDEVVWPSDRGRGKVMTQIDT